MKHATSARVRGARRVTVLALPLALMTWVGAASATGLEARRNPTMSREAGGHALVVHGQGSEPEVGEGLGLRARAAATSGWEWGVGSAGLAAWLLGLGRRWQRPKA
jgi:hypothetical protein